MLGIFVEDKIEFGLLLIVQEFLLHIVVKKVFSRVKVINILIIQEYAGLSNNLII
jgi:hypothetical protein